MQSIFLVGLLLVACLAMSFGAPGLARVGRPQMFLREFRAAKRGKCSIKIIEYPFSLGLQKKMCQCVDPAVAFQTPS